MKILGKMATYPARKDTGRIAVDSIIDQMDHLVLCLNQFDDIPDWAKKNPKITALIPTEDYKDTGKFIPANFESDFTFYLDDDILYPQNYVKHTLQTYDSIGELNIGVGYHGSWYDAPKFGFSRQQLKKWLGFITRKSNPMRYRKCTHFLEALAESKQVEQLGTGLLALPSNLAPPFEFIRGSQKFVDVRFANWCKKNDVSLYCIKHPHNWLTEIDSDLNETIYRTFTVLTPEYVQKEIYSYASKLSHKYAK